jgi:hypothetical protein
MRAFAIAAACLLSANLASGECVVVVDQPQPSSRNVRITVLRDGKPQQNATLILISQKDGKQARPAITTDTRGIVELKDLPNGTYCIEATADPRLGAKLCLNVWEGIDRKPSELALSLSVQPPPPPTFEERVRAAAILPIEQRAQTFVGVVKDLGGGGIPRAEIVIHRRASEGKVDTIKLTTDERGRFSTPLAPGSYTPGFQSPGFKTRFVGFEIVPDAPKQDLPIVLDLDTACG